MAASPAVLAETPESIVLRMSENMEALAAAGAWEEVEDLSIRLRSAVMNVPATNRRAVLLALQQSTENVAARAKTARQDVTGKISDLRRGQAAKKAYELG